MQRLAHIDVAEPSDDTLVGERRLQACLLAPARPRQHGGVERIAERLGAETAQQRFLVEAGSRHELHKPEPARVVEGDGRARRHREHDVIVREMLGPLVMEVAGLALAAVVKDAERARHAEMHQQDFA